jgi:hypothetical protein
MKVAVRVMAAIVVVAAPRQPSQQLKILGKRGARKNERQKGPGKQLCPCRSQKRQLRPVKKREMRI